MKKRMHAYALLLLGVLMAPACLAAGAMTINVKYAGYGYDTATDTNDDGLAVSLSVANGKGTLGNSMLAITVEFGPPDGGVSPCDAAYTWLPVVSGGGHYWAAVLTAANQSQLFALFDQGYLCLREAPPYDYYGMTAGFYAGGTGRFAGAAGEWTTYFEGVNLDPSVGFRSITGTIDGEVMWP